MTDHVLRDINVNWVPELDAIVNALEGDTPRGAQRFRTHAGSPEDVIFSRVRSTSFIAALREAFGCLDGALFLVRGSRPASCQTAEFEHTFLNVNCLLSSLGFTHKLNSTFQSGIVD